MRPLKLTLALAPLLLVAAACSTSVAVPAADVQKQISDQIAAQVGTAPESVSCPSDLAGTVGTTMTCTVVANGTSLQALLTVTKVDGTTVNYEISSLVDPASAAPAASDAASPAAS